MVGSAVAGNGTVRDTVSGVRGVDSGIISLQPGAVQMAQLRIRRRGGLVPRLIFAFALAFLVLEVGLRFILGNGGHGHVIRPARTPEVCWELIPSSSAAYTGDATRQERSSIHVNALGARSPLVGSPSAGRLRVLVLGDGLVFGQGVDDDETLVSRLGQELTSRGHPADVFNYGVPGLSPVQAVATLERHLETLKPEIVVLVVSPNDLDPGVEGCPHQGGSHGDGKVSSSVAREQLLTQVASRSYALRAFRLVRTAGWPALLDPNGPYGPGREPMGRRMEEPTGAQANAAMPPGPWFAQAGLRTTPRERWGDVPILMPEASDVPAIVAQRKEEYVFVEAVNRLLSLGRTHEVEISIVITSDRATFERVSRCDGCRPPQVLLRGMDIPHVDLSALWLQLLRRPDTYFQRGEGFPTAIGYDAMGRALAGELAGTEYLRKRSVP